MGSLRLEQGLFSRGMPISRETILRVGSRMSWVGDPAEEQISHSEEDHGFGDVEALLVSRGLGGDIVSANRYCVQRPTGGE